jgi:hypothetical protein
MTDALMQTLQGIPPTNDTALEDRALACFVVACGELAQMKNTAQRDTLVNQLTTVGRRLVDATLTDAHNKADESGPAQAQARAKESDHVEAEESGHVGLSWDQLEAVLKQEKADRESTSFGRTFF